MVWYKIVIVLLFVLNLTVFGIWASSRDNVSNVPTNEVIETEPSEVPSWVEESRFQQSVRLLEPQEEIERCPGGAIEGDFLDRVMGRLQKPDVALLFLYWENDYVGLGEQSVYVVYVYEDVRYTLWYSPPDDLMEGFVSVWERPNGTHTRRWLDTYTDARLTGCVNFAIGDKSRLGSDRYQLLWDDYGARYDQGVEYHTFWQNRYYLAIEGLAKTLGVSRHSREVEEALQIWRAQFKGGTP
ncbi:MAG: hypothetical protein ABH826_04290 [Patescibacteria group bacterium]|nr:hypothetical protein [Patescibacteria group bacterium]